MDEDEQEETAIINDSKNPHCKFNKYHVNVKMNASSDEIDKDDAMIHFKMISREEVSRFLKQALAIDYSDIFQCRVESSLKACINFLLIGPGAFSSFF